jgi:superfamily II DNA or RNA helicase
VYYAFSRGNLEKLGRLFGDLPWTDKTCAKPMTSDLQFKGALHTWESKQIGQQEAVLTWLRHKGGIIKAPPRFGKTISSIFVMTKLKRKTLIIAHQKDLLEQFYTSFRAFTNIDDVQDIKPKQKKRDAKGRVVGFFGDYDNPEELDVCLLCWQTFASKYGPERISTYSNTWGLIIVDEVHKLGGVCYAKTINRLPARYRLGLTGTVERVDGREFLLNDIIGPVVAEGRVATIPCKVIITHTGLPIRYTFLEPLPNLYKRLYNNQERMEIILNDLLKDVEAGRYICFAFHRCSTKQLINWTDKLKMMGVKAESFYGTCKDREGVLLRARSGETQVLVCNSQMLTGIDVPRWDTYYSAFPTSNVVFNDEGKLSGNYYQEFSRIRTPFEREDGTVKTEGLIRDYVDNNPLCYGSYKKRYRAYTNQKFKLEVVKMVQKIEAPTLD